MAILAECPICRKKQATKNKRCTCNADLDKAKRSKRVRYWISYYLPDGKQKRESVGAFEGLDAYSITDAKDAESKRAIQKREKKLMNVLTESKVTFNNLAVWYLNLRSVKTLASHDRIKLVLDNFNKVYGDRRVSSLKLTDIEDYQNIRAVQGKAPATIDMEVSITKTMVTKAFFNDIVEGQVLKPFNKVKRKLKKGSNARKQTLSFEQYIRLRDAALPHLKACLKIAFYSGMRTGEIRLLKWSYIDRKAGFIRLPAEIPKERKAKNIPINRHVREVLNSAPRALKHDFVITYKGNPIRQKDGLKKSFKSACEKAKVPHGRKTENGITFHDIRRTVKTNMLYAGVEEVYRDLILGHSLQGMDIHYLSVDESKLAEAMNKYTRWVDQNLDAILQSSDQSSDYIEIK